MKRKLFAMTMALTLSGMLFSGGNGFVKMVLAEEAQADTEWNFQEAEGIWVNSETGKEEWIQITDMGMFVYHTEESDTQGYLEYVEEYEGSGRYDMYSRTGTWLSGFYLDSDSSLHMGNVDGAVFEKMDAGEDGVDLVPGTSADGENQEANSGLSEEGSVAEKENSYVLTTSKRYTGLRPMYNNSDWEGGYYYSDMTEDGLTVIVNCSAANDETFTGTPEEYREKFAALVSEADVENFSETENGEYTKKFTYPVYELEFTTGANEDTCKWKMLYFQTDTHTFAYAYKMDADFAEEMESEYQDAVGSLELMEIPAADENGAETDYDPSANGESLEMFIAYFDNWYQYGDLNAASIHLYGEGTWEIYNRSNGDGTGGYLFDSGTFETSGTTALELFSSDGSYVGDVHVDGNDELFFTPAISGYGSIYADAGFSRESESVAYEAQQTEDGMGDTIPEDGQGDYIPDDGYDNTYQEESDPGDNESYGYYWYDGDGDVWYYNGYEDLYIGSGDGLYIDDEGNLCEY